MLWLLPWVSKTFSVRLKSLLNVEAAMESAFASVKVAGVIALKSIGEVCAPVRASRLPPSLRFLVSAATPLSALTATVSILLESMIAPAWSTFQPWSR